MPHSRPHVFFLSLAAILSASAAYAVRPQVWSFDSPKDYSQGQFENTVVDSHGRLSLGQKLTPIKTDSAAEMVSAFAQTPDGAVYVATSPKAKVYKIDGDDASEVYTAPKGFTDITALAADSKGDLLVALSGETARLVRLSVKNKFTPTIRFEDPDVQYIWAIQPAADGEVYLGTGPHGKIFKLPEHGDPETVLDSKSKNITTLAMDGNGKLLAGTDSPGLVIRIDPTASNKPFVLLDAGKVDVNALAVNKGGDIFVATAKAEPDTNPEPEPDETPDKSKPAATEPDVIEPPVDEGTTKKSDQQGALIVPGMILAAPQQELPPAIKALLKKAAEQAANNPGTHKKPTLPNQKSSAKPPEETEENNSEDQSTVYKISADGAVTTLVQEDDLNYSLLLSGDDLLIGTGDEGKLYRYRLADESLALIARVKQEHITNLFADASGAVYLGTANMAQVYRLSNELAGTGTFISQPLDASNSADWGHSHIEVDLPDGSKATIATRSGNTHENDKDPHYWSDWSGESEAGKNEKVSSPVARYLQFRVTLTAGSADGKPVSPEINSVKLVYQTRNLAPQIKNLSVEFGGPASDDSDNDNSDNSGGGSANAKLVHVNWDATDPNGDTLTYQLYYKATGEKDIWTPLAKDLSDTVYEWDTKAIPDGKYVIKLVATDASDNDPQDALQVGRTSAPFTIDHTPPTISDLAATVDGDKATVKGLAKDTQSPIIDVRFQIDGQGDWQPAAASDKIFDSPEEAFSFVTKALATGGHRISVRATDSKGNSAYQAVAIEVKP